MLNTISEPSVCGGKQVHISHQNCLSSVSSHYITYLTVFCMQCLCSSMHVLHMVAGWLGCRSQKGRRSACIQSNLSGRVKTVRLRGPKAKAPNALKSAVEFCDKGANSFLSCSQDRNEGGKLACKWNSGRKWIDVASVLFFYNMCLLVFMRRSSHLMIVMFGIWTVNLQNLAWQIISMARTMLAVHEIDLSGNEKTMHIS